MHLRKGYFQLHHGAAKTSKDLMLLMIILLLNLVVPIVYSFSNGVNLQPSYYNNGNVTFGWDLMHKYSQIKTVRIEIEPDKVEQAKSWISEAFQNGYEIIATYHNCSILGSDNPNDLIYAAHWWVTNYNTLKQSGDFTINLMNEWGSHDQTAETYASAYNNAITIIRQVYSNNLIIDIPGWGQETDIAAAASILIYDQNITLSAHIYPQSWNSVQQRYIQPSDIDTLYNTNRTILIGEFGLLGSGNTDVNSVITRAKELNISVIAWAWNGDGGDMNIITPYWYNNAIATVYSVCSYGNTILSML